MSSRFRIPVALTLVVIWIVSLVGVGSPVLASGEKLGTGLNEPTPEQVEWINRNFPVIQQIRLNSIAVERINVERSNRGQQKLDPAALDLAPVGQEAVFSVAATDASGDTLSVAAELLPETVDNSASPEFPPIRSQGSIGSCASWATTYYQLTYETNLALGRSASNGDNTRIFSPKWTYNIINGGIDGGSYFSDNYAVELKNGAASWAEFPYDSNYRAWPTDGVVWRNALNYRAQSYGQLYNSNVETLIQDIKTQLANGHVLVIGTYVLSWAQTTIKDDPATAEVDPYVNQKIAPYVKNTNSGGHGMTVVGYDDSIWCDLNSNNSVDSGEKGAFKIANSWGTSDWNAGYRWVSYDALRAVSLAPATSTWPTTDRSSSGIFWSGNIFTLTTSGYAPSMVASVTLNSAYRGQLRFSLGTGTLSSTIPVTSWYPKALYYTGGGYAFDGTTTACDATFYFDFTDLDTGSDNNQRWFASLYDSTSGSPVYFSSYRLYTVDSSGDTLVGSGSGLPVTADASQVYSWVDYTPGGLNYPPEAVISATPQSGDLPLTVNFDATASSDSDGQIVDYSWSFGDGTLGSGPAASHIYTAAGTYTAVLTVTDDRGATDSASLAILAVDPNLINAPSELAASAAGKTVNLTWRDNSNNETGFYVERAVKVKGSYTYTRIATLSANVTAYSQSVSSGTYRYRVQAFNQNTGQVSDYSDIVSIRIK